MKLIFRIAVSFILMNTAAHATTLLEPKLSLPAAPAESPRVALTFDACSGKVDERILQALIDNKISATIFVTARWLHRNPKAVEQIKANSSLFEIENHGAKHRPAIDQQMRIYGLDAAGSSAAIRTEIADGDKSVFENFGVHTKWFRGATGRYTSSSEKIIADLHVKLAGYSVLGDGGASFSKSKATFTISSVKDGDVIVAHINQPDKPAGQGVVDGILKLKAKGFSFVKLQDALP